MTVGQNSMEKKTCSLTKNLYHSYLSGAPTHILDNPHFYPRVTSILCKSGLCVVLHLRANYILVSFSEYHPDKHYTWLPFPAAQCNPSLQKKNRKKRRRKRDTETERGVKRERKKKREEFKRGKSLHRSKKKRKKRICQNVEWSTDLIKETDCFRLSEKHVAL